MHSHESIALEDSLTRLCPLEVFYPVLEDAYFTAFLLAKSTLIPYLNLVGASSTKDAIETPREPRSASSSP